MVIKNLENKIKLVTIFCGFFPCRMRPYQPVKHLDSKG